MTRLVSIHVFDVLSLLTPFDIDIPKLRIGRDRDGGYVLADLRSREDVISFGISQDVGFERHMAERGHRLIHMFDHTIDGLPEQNERFRFKRIGICAAGESEPNLLTLDQHMAEIGLNTNGLTLKIDVEGYEWGVFANMRPELLLYFEQIIVEVHWLANLGQLAFAQQVSVALKNLNFNFTLFHVHANNHCGLHVVDGFALPDVLELSYVRNDLVERRPSQTLYPTTLDRGNDPKAADYPLLFYPFLPTGQTASRVADTVQRVISEVG